MTPRQLNALNDPVEAGADTAPFFIERPPWRGAVILEMNRGGAIFDGAPYWHAIVQILGTNRRPLPTARWDAQQGMMVAIAMLNGVGRPTKIQCSSDKMAVHARRPCTTTEIEIATRLAAARAAGAKRIIDI